MQASHFILEHENLKVRNVENGGRERSMKESDVEEGMSSERNIGLI